MTDTTATNYNAWVGHTVTDRSGDKVGKVSAIYLDETTGTPEWLAVHTGLFASHASFVPLAGATADGDTLVISHDKAKVKDAPRVEQDADGFLTPQEEEHLYRYYGRDYAAEASTTRTTPETGDAGFDTSGPNTDQAMTRSEEEITVGVQQREAGRVRLRKYVVTEQVTQTVPVSHEELRIEREPITDANRDAAMTGGEITEEEHEIVLHEERPVVQKEVVPVERVRLDKETVTNEETVTEEVRKERIEEEGNKIPGTERPN
jgi:uncharacterized protein (TIGR02271 family)